MIEFCGHFSPLNVKRNPHFSVLFELPWCPKCLNLSKGGLFGPECHMSGFLYSWNISSGFPVVRQPICNQFSVVLPLN